MKTIFKLMKKVIIASFCLYFYNIIAIKYDFVIPINFFTILIVSIFDFFGLIGLILFKFLVL